MKAKDYRREQEGRRREPIAPAHQALQQICKKHYEGALGAEIAYSHKNGKKQEYDRSHLPADRYYRLLWRLTCSLLPTLL